jgi:hypothetical protein
MTWLSHTVESPRCTCFTCSLHVLRARPVEWTGSGPTVDYTANRSQPASWLARPTVRLSRSLSGHIPATVGWRPFSLSRQFARHQRVQRHSRKQHVICVLPKASSAAGKDEKTRQRARPWAYRGSWARFRASVAGRQCCSVSLCFFVSVSTTKASRSDSQQCKSSRQPGHSAPPSDCACYGPRRLTWGFPIACWDAVDAFLGHGPQQRGPAQLSQTLLLPILSLLTSCLCTARQISPATLNGPMYSAVLSPSGAHPRPQEAAHSTW